METDETIYDDAPVVLLLGDTHGNPSALLEAYQRSLIYDTQAIIQLGDYGYGWRMDDQTGHCIYSQFTASLAEQYELPFYWVDGNHENFDRLYELSADENGHRQILPGVTHLGRGSTITFGETKFLALGGAYSVDKPHRAEGKSWWPQETITDAEMELAISAGPADVFLSHDAPYGTQSESELFWLEKTFGPDAVPKSIANQQKIRQALDASGAKVAYHGHLHRSYERTLDTGCIVRCLNKETDNNSIVVLPV